MWTISNRAFLSLTATSSSQHAQSFKITKLWQSSKHFFFYRPVSEFVELLQPCLTSLSLCVSGLSSLVFAFFCWFAVPLRCNTTVHQELPRSQCVILLACYTLRFKNRHRLSEPLTAPASHTCLNLCHETMSITELIGCGRELGLQHMSASLDISWQIGASSCVLQRKRRLVRST